MKTLKILGYIVGGAIVLSIVLVAGLTSIITTSWGQTKLLDYVNTHIPGKITADQIHLSWFGDQQIDGLVLKGQDGEIIARSDQIKLASPLFKLITNREVGSAASIKGLQATIKLSSEGSFNLSDALGIPSPKLKSSTPFIPIQINDVNAEINIEGFFRNAHLTASGNTLQGTQKGNFELTGEGGAQPKLVLKATHFPVAIIDQLSALKYPDYVGLYTLALGEYIDFTIDQIGTPEHAEFEGKLNAPNLTTQFKGSFQADKFILQTPVIANFTITPALYQKIQQLYPSKQYPAINSPLLTKLMLSEAAIALNNNEVDLFNSSIKGEFSVGPNVLNLPDNQGQIDLQSISMLFTSLAGITDVQFSLHTEAKQNGSPLKADVQATLQKPKKGMISGAQVLKALQVQARMQGIPYLGKKWNLDLDSTNKGTHADALVKIKTDTFELPEMKLAINHANLDDIQAKLSIQSFPVAMLSTFAPGKDFTSLLGQSLSFDINGNFDQNGQGKFQMDLQGKNLQGQAALAYTDHLHLQKDSDVPTLKLVISPEQMEQIHKDWVTEGQAPFKLAKPLTITFFVPELEMNFQDPTKGADLIAQVELKDLSIIDPVASKKLTLGEIKGKIETNQNSDLLAWQFNVSGLGEGTLKLLGTLPSPFNSNKDLSFANLNFHIHMDSEGIPIGIASRFAGFDPKVTKAIESMLGKRVEIKADVKITSLSGPVLATISGDNGSVELDGQMSNGVLRLNRSLTAQCTVNPPVGQDVFGLVLPILNSAISSDAPLLLQINPEGFAFPVSPYDFKLISVPKGNLSLGKMGFNSQGDLAQLLGLLNVKTQDNLNVWFTPIYFSLKQEAVKVERFDMLVGNTYPLAVWGNIDFQNDYVNLEVGLTAKALAKALGIKGYDSKGMLQVPLRGPIGNPKIDKSKVSAQVAKIALQAQIPGGNLIGDVLGAASSILGGETQSPAPTTNPLPWKLESDDPDSSDNKKLDLKDHVQKGVNSLLNSFIPK